MMMGHNFFILRVSEPSCVTVENGVVPIRVYVSNEYWNMSRVYRRGHLFTAYASVTGYDKFSLTSCTGRGLDLMDMLW